MLFRSVWNLKKFIFFRSLKICRQEKVVLPMVQTSIRSFYVTITKTRDINPRNLLYLTFFHNTIYETAESVGDAENQFNISQSRNLMKHPYRQHRKAPEGYILHVRDWHIIRTVRHPSCNVRAHRECPKQSA